MCGSDFFKKSNKLFHKGVRKGKKLHERVQIQKIFLKGVYRNGQKGILIP